VFSLTLDEAPVAGHEFGEGGGRALSEFCHHSMLSVDGADALLRDV
jgi:hypothetical protein